MATQPKTDPITESVETAAERVAKLNEKAVANGKKAGAAYLRSYEKAVLSLADSYEQAAGATQVEWLATVTESDLERIVESPLVPGGRCAVAHALTQVCLHSQGHRSQCATMLRRLGGAPPTTDFILWITKRSEPAW